MILPTKHLSANAALLTVGGILLSHLDQPRTVSALWDTIRRGDKLDAKHALSYDWFVLALDLLYICGAVTHDRGRIVRNSP